MNEIANRDQSASAESRTLTFHPGLGRVGTRGHIRAEVEVFGNAARLSGQRQRMTVARAVNDESHLDAGLTVPTTPGDEGTVLRWCGPLEIGHDYWMVTLLVPGHTTTDVRLAHTAWGARVELEAGAWSEALEVSQELDLLAAGQDDEEGG